MNAASHTTEQTNKSSSLLKSLLLFVVVLGMFLFSINIAHALTISPARVELEGDPGNVFNGEVKLVNDTEETKTYYASFENFEAQGETGTPNFVERDTGLSSWIEAQGSVTLAPNEETVFPYTIRIPEDAEPGGHFAAIFWTTTPPNEGSQSQVAVSSKVGMLILLSLGGDFEEGGGIVEFDTREGQRVFNTLPVNFFYRFQNDGADRLKPSGDVVIRNTLRIKDETLNANPTEGNVLPRSVRRFQVTWGEKPEQQPEGFFEHVATQWNQFALGWYTAKLDVSYGDQMSDNEKVHFFVLPWQLLIVLIIGLIIIRYVLAFLLRRYNRWVISQAQQHQNTDTN